MNKKDYPYIEEEATNLAEPSVSAWNKRVLKNAQSKKETDGAVVFMTDEAGRILLTSEQKNAIAKAEQDLENGKCISEDAFKTRFAKWL